MLDSIGATAVRTLGIDIANLTAKIAVQTAILEEIMQTAAPIDTSVWQQIEPDPDAAPTPPMIGLPADQADRVQALLALIQSVQ